MSEPFSKAAAVFILWLLELNLGTYLREVTGAS